MTAIDGVQRPDSPPVNRPIRRPVLPIVTLALILTNVALFLGIELFQQPLIETLGLHFPKHQDFAWWQYATHMFIHDGWMHVLLNMMVLWVFGRALEQVWGHALMLIFYVVMGIGAALLYVQLNTWLFNQAVETILAAGLSPSELQQILANGQYIPVIEETAVATRYYNTTMVGASGATFGLLVCFAVLFPNYKLMLLLLPVPIAAKILVPLLVAMELFSAITGQSLFGNNIAHGAHLAGALLGLTIISLWLTLLRSSSPEQKPPQ